jgi:hypothetical protein
LYAHTAKNQFSIFEGSPLLILSPARRVWFHFDWRMRRPAAMLAAKSSAIARWWSYCSAVSPGFSRPARRMPSVTCVTPYPQSAWSKRIVQSSASVPL